jgi:hypothetical protein
MRAWRWMQEVDTNVAHPHWPDAFFARLVDAHLRRTANHGGLVGDARSHVLRARALFDFALPIMTRVARDASVLAELLGPDQAGLTP